MKFTADTPNEVLLAAPRPLRWLHHAVRYWAYLGGLLLLGITAIEAANALMKLLTGSSHAAEHELVKYMVGIAIFTFLPYCQLNNGHIAVDIFTQGISARARAVLAFLGALLGAAISILLIKQMYLGMQSYIDYREVTAVLKLPIWTAFPFVLCSLALWTLACLASMHGHWQSFSADLRARRA